MPEPLFEPIPIAYRGLLADHHFVDAQQFGRSLIGATKLANSICHELFWENITHDPRSYHIRFCVGPSRESGLLQEIFAISNSGQLPLYSPILITVAKKFIELSIKAVIDKVLSRKDGNKAVDRIHELAMAHSEFARQVHEGHMRDKAWLQRMITNMARENRASVRQLPDPVGRTVNHMQIGDSSVATVIDEPAAEVLRSPDTLSLGDKEEYVVRIHGVFKTNGACRVEILNEPKKKIVSGKIADDELGRSGNIYTRALNEGLAIKVIAQPTIKDGKINRLFITQGEISEKGLV
ncbi:hypothetical protein M2212_003105 [Bradyrhizobium elkanii]|jgi:hypothetical protein|uniref:DUF7947 five-stranded beta-barrel domain-containing protein n=1 Tax=Bradyrhizobium elkanii TaxID=29448 RepID=UPI00216A18B5|nr:hypothetical protein [Bradyrhizobium elkanii]MCS3476259.1 hypothetical protein [Bradyrhizobium elkanii]MCS3686670.1 hypothetical protein [Bradyrhizobium elkanii]